MGQPRNLHGAYMPPARLLMLQQPTTKQPRFQPSWGRMLRERTPDGRGPGSCAHAAMAAHAHPAMRSAGSGAKTSCGYRCHAIAHAHSPCKLPMHTLTIQIGLVVRVLLLLLGVLNLLHAMPCAPCMLASMSGACAGRDALRRAAALAPQRTSISLALTSSAVMAI